METIVVNIKKKATDIIRKEQAKRFVYIGRPSLWGNPFTHLHWLQRHGIIIVQSPIEAVTAYRDWLKGDDYTRVDQKRREDILANLRELNGKILGCYCKPGPCHGDVLVELLEAREYKNYE